jgi:hypothetical protein
MSEMFRACVVCAQSAYNPVLTWYCSDGCCQADGWVRTGDGWERP